MENFKETQTITLGTWKIFNKFKQIQATLRKVTKNLNCCKQDLERFSEIQKIVENYELYVYILVYFCLDFNIDIILKLTQMVETYLDCTLKKHSTQNFLEVS